MTKPDYTNSIANLMSSIVDSFDVENPYQKLSGLDWIDGKENVVLLVLDGIGYEYLKEKGKDTVFYENLKRKITSVFPSSTPSAVTTFMTGLPPQQHGVTGWYTYLRELGVVSTILPFKPRYGKTPFIEKDVDVGSILSDVSLVKKIEDKKYFVTRNKIKDSAFNSFYTPNIDVRGYEKTEGMFDEIQNIIEDDDGRKYIYGYWNNYDSAAHENGFDSVDSWMELLRIDRNLNNFVEEIKDTDTALLITSDHGFIDTTKDKTIRLEDHPEFADCLTIPLCGDQRSIFCYLHPDRTDKFEDYWQAELSDRCDLYKSKELVEEGYFGSFEPSTKFLDRIGDYILIMKDDHVMYDTLPNEDDHFLKGNHGGVSSREMYVPLSVLDL